MEAIQAPDLDTHPLWQRVQSQIDGFLKDFGYVESAINLMGIQNIAMDPTGQGERKNFYDTETGKVVVPNSVPDHDCCGVPSLTTGRFLTWYFLSDQLAAVDYMLTRPEIDPRRIGVTGCSGGGVQSLLSMTVDDRIAAAAPATFLSTRREIQYTCQSQDSEQIWRGGTTPAFPAPPVLGWTTPPTPPASETTRVNPSCGGCRRI